MNLIVHQDNCQMVTGNIMRVRVCPGAGEIPGAEDQDFTWGVCAPVNRRWSRWCPVAVLASVI